MTRCQINSRTLFRGASLPLKPRSVFLRFPAPSHHHHPHPVYTPGHFTLQGQEDFSAFVLALQKTHLGDLSPECTCPHTFHIPRLIRPKGFWHETHKQNRRLCPGPSSSSHCSKPDSCFKSCCSSLHTPFCIQPSAPSRTIFLLTSLKCLLLSHLFPALLGLEGMKKKCTSFLGEVGRQDSN